MTTYFDSSVLVKAYCLESTSLEAVSLIRRTKPPLPFTLVHGLEIRNALRLKRYRKELTERQMKGALRHIQEDINTGFLQSPELDFQLLFNQAEILSASHTTTTGARSLDIIHVAVAMLLKVEKFVSYDRRQRMLAKGAGMAILPRSIPKSA